MNDIPSIKWFHKQRIKSQKKQKDNTDSQIKECVWQANKNIKTGLESSIFWDKDLTEIKYRDLLNGISDYYKNNHEDQIVSKVIERIEKKGYTVVIIAGKDLKDKSLIIHHPKDQPIKKNWIIELFRKHIKKEA